jgi:hypothetical protein
MYRHLSIFILLIATTAQNPIPRVGDSCPTGTYRSGDYCKPFAATVEKDVTIIQKSGDDCPTGFALRIDPALRPFVAFSGRIVGLIGAGLRAAMRVQSGSSQDELDFLVYYRFLLSPDPGDTNSKARIFPLCYVSEVTL